RIGHCLFASFDRQRVEIIADVHPTQIPQYLPALLVRRQAHWRQANDRSSRIADDKQTKRPCLTKMIPPDLCPLGSVVQRRRAATSVKLFPGRSQSFERGVIGSY